MRTPTACAQCRLAKRRCTRQENSEACISCKQRQLTCEVKLQIQLPGQRPLVPRSPPTLSNYRQPSQHPEPQLDPGPNLPQGTTIELVDHYLDKFHGRPHTIFHPTSLRSLVRNGKVNKTLLYAICAIGCKFSGNPDTRGQGSDLAAKSKRLLQADLLNISLGNIQACTLVAMLSVGHGDSASEALFFRIALTMAEIMRLNSPPSGGSVIDREIRRRVWWSLYMTDLWCISGQGLHSQLKDIEPNIELPMNDSTFMSLRPEQVTIGSVEPGIWAHMTTLVRLFDPIHNLSRIIASGENHAIDLDKRVEQLSQSLEDWKQSLPIDAQLSQDSLRRQQKEGLGGLLLSVHLTYNFFSILLYFRYLEAQQPVSSTDRTYIARCKAHASSFSYLLLQSRQLKGCDVVYPNIGHMTTVSSSVLVHTLLYGDLDEHEKVNEELNANFEALVELSQYWPATSAMIERLVLFQDMCLLSTEVGTNKLDGWMLRFLIEHSLDIEAKKMKNNPSSWNVDSEKMSSKAKELAEQGRYLHFPVSESCHENDLRNVNN